MHVPVGVTPNACIASFIRKNRKKKFFNFLKKSDNFFFRHATPLSLRAFNFSGRFTPETPVRTIRA